MALGGPLLLHPENGSGADLSGLSCRSDRTVCVQSGSGHILDERSSCVWCADAFRPGQLRGAQPSFPVTGDASYRPAQVRCQAAGTACLHSGLASLESCWVIAGLTSWGRGHLSFMRTHLYQGNSPSPMENVSWLYGTPWDSQRENLTRKKALVSNRHSHTQSESRGTKST